MGKLLDRAAGGGNDLSMVVVRALKPDEWETKRDIRLAGLRDAPEAFGGSYADSAGRSEQEWRGWPQGGQAFIAFDGGAPVGVACGWRKDEEKNITKLIGMWVAPEARGKGVADELIEAVLGWAGEQDCEAVELTVYETNTRALGAYLKNGFVAVRSKDYSGKMGTVMRREVVR